jgi:hypothetical protein
MTEQKKTYYVDCHKKSEQTALIRVYKQISYGNQAKMLQVAGIVTLKEYEDLQSPLGEDKIRPQGYRFRGKRSASDMIKFHIDHYPRLQEIASGSWVFGEM